MGTIVVLLHTLRAKRRPHRVSSLFLWQRVQRELAANHRRRRLIKSLLLFLQLLVLSLLALALAGPSLPKQQESFHVGIIVDTSASMAVGATQSHAALAMERIESFLTQGRADRYLLWATTGDLLYYDGSSKEELVARLAALPPPGGASDWEGLYEQVAAAVSGEEPFHLIIATDGAVRPNMVAPLRLAGPGINLHLIDVGQPADNLAITAFSARPSGRADGHHQILLHVDNLGHRPVETELSVVAHYAENESPLVEPPPPGESAQVFSTRLSLAPGASKRVLFEHAFLPGERLIAQIQSEDPFPVDDVAYLIGNPQGTTRVLLIGEENRFLNQGFASFPQVETAHSFDPYTALAHDVYYDLVVFYGEELPDGFRGSALIFESDPVVSGVPAEITWWDRRHPVSRFVDWEIVSVGLVRALSPEPAETVLLQSTAGPLITLLEEPGRRVIRVAIPFGHSDFPFRVAFPVFLQNVLDWVNPDGQAAVPPATSLGRLPKPPSQPGATMEALFSWESQLERSWILGSTPEHWGTSRTG